MPLQQTKSPSSSLSVLLSACTLLLQFCAVLLLVPAVQAETRYVKPSSEVVVRRGQGTDYKIIAMVKDGTPVQFMEEGKDYAKVQLANGKAGWMLKRFLSSEPPLNEIVDSLRMEREKMQQQKLETGQQLETLSTVLSRTELDRDAAINERNQIQASYKKLQEETANVVLIKNNLQKVTEEKRALTERVALLEQEYNEIKNDYALKWFLAGGGVLVFGMLIGQMFGKTRKRKSSLLS